MKQFLVPFNNKIYKGIEAYEKLEEIDWTMKTKMNIDDEVYFYCSNPIKKILIKGIVTKIDVEFDEMIEDSEFYVEKNKKKFDNGKKYTRIKIIENIPGAISELLSFEKLKENGLKSVQSTQMIDKNIELSEYINYVMQQKNIINEINDDCEMEGKKIPYYMKRYERNSKNRENAIKIHGLKCMCCGFNFEDVYGELGKDFIEVHHKNPICNLEEEQLINPRTDLVCLCSNCHSMIHRNRQEIISVEKLKENILIKKNLRCEKI